MCPQSHALCGEAVATRRFSFAVRSSVSLAQCLDVGFGADLRCSGCGRGIRGMGHGNRLKPREFSFRRTVPSALFFVIGLPASPMASFFLSEGGTCKGWRIPPMGHGSTVWR